MTVKELMDVLDKSVKVNIYEEHDIAPVFFSVKNNHTTVQKTVSKK